MKFSTLIGKPIGIASSTTSPKEKRRKNSLKRAPMNSVRDTALSACDSIQFKLGTKQKQVLDVLRLSQTNEELNKRLGWTITA